MLGLYRITGDRYRWWVESWMLLVYYITAIFAILVSILSFGHLSTVWNINWFAQFWAKKRTMFIDYPNTGEARVHRIRKVYVDYENTGLGASTKVHYSKEKTC